MTILKTDYNEPHLSFNDKVATANILTQLQQECHQSPQFPLQRTKWSQACFQLNSQIKVDSAVSELQIPKNLTSLSPSRRTLGNFQSESIDMRESPSYFQTPDMNSFRIGELMGNDMSQIAQAPVSIRENALLSELRRSSMRIRALQQPQMVSSSDLTFNGFANPLLFSRQFRPQEQQKKTNILNPGAVIVPLNMLCQLIDKNEEDNQIYPLPAASCEYSRQYLSELDLAKLNQENVAISPVQIRSKRKNATQTLSKTKRKKCERKKIKKPKECRMHDCFTEAAKNTPYCAKHSGTRICEHEGCRKCAQGRTRFCIGHGGGRRCTFPGCSKGARDYRFCAGHGGGRRCEVNTCEKSAVGGTNKCSAHGGGRRCQKENCDKSAQSGTNFCVKHGGGKRCIVDGCTKVARGKSNLCMNHRNTNATA